ncbi:MAG: OmpA family protein [Nonlabens sp.]
MKKIGYILVLFSTVCAAQLIETHSVYFDVDKDVFVSMEGKELNLFLDDLLYKPLLDVKILGYCDDRGSHDYNLDLSNRRVENVSAHLQQHSIDVSHIIKKVEGKGEVALINRDSNDDSVSDERAQNRRVDIIFSLKEAFLRQVPIKKLQKNALTDGELKIIDTAEKPAINAIQDSIKKAEEAVEVPRDSIISIPEDELIDVPTKMSPPVDNGKEPFKSLLSKNLKKGQVIKLEDILFFKGRSTMLAESKPLLERVAEILAARKDIEFEIHGHVCCINPYYEDAYNRDTRKTNLSSDRAKTIYNLLQKRGVSKKRMKYIGFGRTRPLGGSDKLDRRVELFITKVGGE